MTMVLTVMFKNIFMRVCMIKKEVVQGLIKSSPPHCVDFDKDKKIMVPY